jgi:tRNA A-37 threonylcarbamoyl transferase component Bud32
MAPNIENLREIMRMIKPTWPKIHKYIGGGANGRIFELNDGRYMKIIANNAPQEWKSLLRLQGTRFVPRFNKNNYLSLGVDRDIRQPLKTMLNINRIGKRLTLMIMGRVGGGQAMTLSKYIRKFPATNMRTIQARIFNIIDEMHVRGVSHGNLHQENILVTADSAGRITGMWVIDFGRSRLINLGSTERQHYSGIESFGSHLTRTLNGKHVFVPVHNISRMNVNMAKTYGQNYPKNRENKIKKRRLNIAKNLKLLQTPRKVSSVRRTKSVSLPRRRAT